jgi:DNA-binding NarL/FixJ family response regulator
MRLTRRLRVVVADDHRVFRQGLCALLRQHKGVHFVGGVRNGEEAVLMVRKKHPDVLLLDLDMPVLNGISVARILSRSRARPKIIFLTSYEEEAKVVAAMHAGADGYVTKRVDIDHLVEIMKDIMAGRAPVSPFLADLPLDSLRQSSDALVLAPSLTGMERKVLRLVAQGLSNREIARSVYMSPDSIKVYLKSIFEKLNVRNRTQAAVLAFQMGLGGPLPSSKAPLASGGGRATNSIGY